MISIINKNYTKYKKKRAFYALSSDGTDVVIHENALCLEIIIQPDYKDQNRIPDRRC